MAHRCPSPGCTARVPHGRFACRSHWFTIPKNLRDELWAAFRNHGVLSEEYAEAATACEAFLSASQR